MTKKPTQQTPMSRDEIEAMIVAVVQRELSALVAALDARAMERNKGTGSRVTKRTVSIPSDLWNQLRRECPGPASSHVTAAIRLYLTVRQGEGS
jgi:hypothetical protein